MRVWVRLGAIFMIITEVVSLEVGAWAQAATGMIALIIGVWHLEKFMRAYPLPDEEDFDKLSHQELNQTDTDFDKLSHQGKNKTDTDFERQNPDKLNSTAEGDNNGQ